MPGLILLRGAQWSVQIANLEVEAVVDNPYLAHGTAVDPRQKITAAKEVFLSWIQLV